MPVEQGHAEFVLERPNAGSYVRLNRVQLDCGLVHAAEPRDRLEEAKITQLHDGSSSEPSPTEIAQIATDHLCRADTCTTIG